MRADYQAAILCSPEHNRPPERRHPWAALAVVIGMKPATETIRISEELKHYIVALVASTRSANGVQLGASPRASIALMKAAQALALFDAADFVEPEQIREVAGPGMAPRLVLEREAALPRRP